MLTTKVILIALITAQAALLLVAAYGDVMNRRIPNRLTGAVAATGLLFMLTQWVGGMPLIAAVLYPAVTAFALLAVGLLLFALGILGGGDVKLLAAFGLMAGPHLTPEFLVLTALLGGALALGMILALRLFPAIQTDQSWMTGTSETRPVTLPYGVAISGGGLWVCQALLSALIA